MMNMPVSPIRDKAEYIIAVNLVPRNELGEEEVTALSGIAARTFNLAAFNTIEPEIKYCDVLIEPSEIYKYSRFNFTQIKAMYDIGYAEARRMIPRILDDLAERAISYGHPSVEIDAPVVVEDPQVDVLLERRGEGHAHGNWGEWEGLCLRSTRTATSRDFGRMSRIGLHA